MPKVNRAVALFLVFFLPSLGACSDSKGHTASPESIEEACQLVLRKPVSLKIRRLEGNEMLRSLPCLGGGLCFDASHRALALRAEDGHFDIDFPGGPTRHVPKNGGISLPPSGRIPGLYMRGNFLAQVESDHIRIREFDSGKNYSVPIPEHMPGEILYELDLAEGGVLGKLGKRHEETRTLWLSPSTSKSLSINSRSHFLEHGKIVGGAEYHEARGGWQILDDRDQPFAFIEGQKFAPHLRAHGDHWSFKEQRNLWLIHVGSKSAKKIPFPKGHQYSLNPLGVFVFGPKGGVQYSAKGKVFAHEPGKGVDFSGAKISKEARLLKVNYVSSESRLMVFERYQKPSCLVDERISLMDFKTLERVSLEKGDRFHMHPTVYGNQFLWVEASPEYIWNRP